MIIVWGSLEAREGVVDELLALSLEHVRRSRKEPGCISHAVHIDAENHNRLVFVEQWESLAALQAHFAVPESGRFVEQARGLAVGMPELKIYDASELAM